MTWTKLLANGEVQKHRTAKNELDNMRALIARDLADAAVKGLSPDRRFATAYDAALQAATMAIACAGYRVTGNQEICDSRVQALEVKRLRIMRATSRAQARLGLQENARIPLCDG